MTTRSSISVKPLRLTIGKPPVSVYEYTDLFCDTDMLCTPVLQTPWQHIRSLPRHHHRNTPHHTTTSRITPYPRTISTPRPHTSAPPTLRPPHRTPPVLLHSAPYGFRAPAPHHAPVPRHTSAAWHLSPRVLLCLCGQALCAGSRPAVAVIGTAQCSLPRAVFKYHLDAA